MTVSIILNHGAYKRPLYNIKGNRLVFDDKAHAEYWAKCKGIEKYEIYDNGCNFDNELGRSSNVWEYENHIPLWFQNVMRGNIGADRKPVQITIFDLL